MQSVTDRFPFVYAPSSTNRAGTVDLPHHKVWIDDKSQTVRMLALRSPHQHIEFALDQYVGDGPPLLDGRAYGIPVVQETAQALLFILQDKIDAAVEALHVKQRMVVSGYSVEEPEDDFDQVLARIKRGFDDSLASMWGAFSPDQQLTIDGSKIKP